MMDEPLQIIKLLPPATTGHKSQMILDTATLTNLLSKANDVPFAILSICGEARQGKSYFLSCLIKYLQCLEKNETPTIDLGDDFSGFKFINGTEPITSGVWMWSKPFFIEQDDGTKLALFLVDSQGLFDKWTGNREWAGLAGIALLTSSCLLYNTVHSLKEDILQLFATFCESTTAVSEDNDDDQFQKLIFLIRDFNYPDPFDYGTVGGKKYIEKRLMSDPMRDSNESQICKKLLKESFHDGIECCVLPSPGEEAKRKKFNGAISQLEPKFATKLSRFIGQLTLPGAIPVKKAIASNCPMSTTEFISLLKNFEDAYNSYSNLNSESLVQINIQTSNESMLEQSFRSYFESMEKIDMGTLSINDFDIHHKNLMSNAIQKFQQSKKFGPKEVHAKFENKLAHKIKLAFATFKANHENAEVTFVSKLTDHILKSFCQEVEQLTKSIKLYQFEDMVNDHLNKALRQFEEELNSKLGRIKPTDSVQLQLQLQAKVSEANEHLKRIFQIYNSRLKNATTILKKMFQTKLYAFRQEFGEFVPSQDLQSLVESTVNQVAIKLNTDLNELRISDEDVKLIFSKLQKEGDILLQEILAQQCTRDGDIITKMGEIFKGYQNNLHQSTIEKSMLQSLVLNDRSWVNFLENYLRHRHFIIWKLAESELETSCGISDTITFANYKKKLEDATNEHFNKYLVDIQKTLQSIEEAFCTEQAKASNALAIELRKNDSDQAAAEKLKFASEQSFQKHLKKYIDNPLIQKLYQKFCTEFDSQLQNTLKNVQEAHFKNIVTQQQELETSMETAIKFYDNQFQLNSKFTKKEHFEAKQKAIEQFEGEIAHIFIPNVRQQNLDRLIENLDSKWEKNKAHFDANVTEFKTRAETLENNLIQNFQKEIEAKLYDSSGEKFKIFELSEIEATMYMECQKIQMSLETFCINNNVDAGDYLDTLNARLAVIKLSLQNDFQLQLSRYNQCLQKATDDVTEEYENTIKHQKNDFNAQSELVVNLINKVLIFVNERNLKIVVNADDIRNGVLEKLRSVHEQIPKNFFGFGTQSEKENVKVESVQDVKIDGPITRSMSNAAKPGTSKSTTTKNSQPTNRDEEISIAVESFKAKLKTIEKPCSVDDKQKLEEEISKIIKDFPSKNASHKERLKKNLEAALKERLKTLDELHKIGLEKQKAIPNIAFEFYKSEFEKNRAATDFLAPLEINGFHKKSVEQAKLKFKLTPDQSSKFVTLSNKYLENSLLELAKSSEKDPVIGIDLGTTFSCVSIFWEGKMTVIPNESGRKTTPSYVAFKEDDSVIVGDAAKSRAFIDPENTIFDAKRLIGRNFEDAEVQKDITQWPFKVVHERGMTKIEVRGKTYYPEQIGALVLIELKKVAENFLKRTVTSAVITVPAYFNDGQRQATRDAGAIAGLNVIRIINEPTAAAFAYSLKWPASVPKKVLIFDFGGGTFDISILAMSRGQVETLGVHGDTHMGGEDVDSNLVNYCVQQFKKKTGIDLLEHRDSKDPVLKGQANRRLRRLRHKCEEEKINLSAEALNSVTIELSAIHNQLDLNVELSKSLFEQLNAPLFDKAITLVKVALEEVKLSKEEIDEIVLVGGSTRIPKVRNMLQELFPGKKINSTINPDEAVACGAALQAAILSGSMENQRKLHGLGDEHTGIVALKVSDVTPYATGVELLDGNMSTIIPKNSSVPVQKTENYLTAYDNQTSVLIVIYEGEKTVAAKNHKVGEFYLNGIPPGKAGEQKIEVTLSIDDEGILHMTGMCEFKGRRSELVVREHKGRISAREKRSLIEITKSQ